MKRRFHLSLFLFIALLVVIFISYSFASQKPNNQSLQKLDARLQQILNASKTKTASIESASQDVLSVHNADGDVVYPCFIYGDNFEQIRASGVHLNSVIKDFATARLTITEIEQLSTNESVNFITPTTIEYIHNDVARGLIGADALHSGYVNSTQYTGTGVLVGIIDTGIDWKHLDFRSTSDTTQSRILYIWDQTITATGGETAPSGYAYGVEYTQAQINNELDGTPASFVREADIHGHGTHVAGTAAGNGGSLTTRKYKGMAPGAELIIVKAGNGSFPTTNTVDAISYLSAKATAEGKPLVINMSLGSDAGPHDGTDANGLAVSSIAGAGRIPVMSAGNSGGDPIHFSGTINASSSTTITFTVPSYTVASGALNDAFGFDIWIEDNSSINALIISPNSDTATQNANSAAYTYTDDGRVYLYNYLNANNGDREIYSTISDSDPAKPPAAGTWTIQLTNTTGSAKSFHGWLYDYTIGSNLQTVSVTGGNVNYTVSNASDSAIIVGAYASRWRWITSDGTALSYGLTNGSDDIASFSSLGPSRTGNIKPDIAAPGQAIISSRSSGASFTSGDIVPGNVDVVMQGTSMSSPVVAGSVALLLQQNSNLTPSEIKSLIESTASTDAFTGSVPNNTWGYGKLDVMRAVIKAINPGFSNARSILAYDEWISQLTATISSTLKIAVKFSPSSNGEIIGTFFHPSTPVTLTGPVYAEVWSDNGSGLPGSKLGSTVSFSQDAILANSWNYIDMTGANVSVSSGSNYHIVFYYTSGTSFKMFYDNGNNDSRSSYNSGGPWATYTSGDYRIRPVMMTDISTLPVELFAFTATVQKEFIKLEWNTATEVNNYGFEIERASLPARPAGGNPSKGGTSEAPLRGVWGAIGFVEGSGTINTMKEYSFTDKNLTTGKYLYRLKQIDNNGNFNYSHEIEISTDQSPKRYFLAQNYPNPFNPETKIEYELPVSSHVVLKVYDVLGKEVVMLVNEKQDAGEYFVNFNPKSLSSGIYFYMLRTGSFVETKKMLLIK